MDDFSHFNEDFSLSDDDDIFYPGQFDAEQTEYLENVSDMLEQMRHDSEIESQKNKHRFIIQTVLSVAALIASVVAATAAVIALL